MADCDSGYKLLFSHPELVADLLRGFVPEPWVAAVDFTTLTPVKGSYVSDTLKQRHDDVVWKVRLRDQWLYIYLVIEFQSTPDPFMALRLLVYVGLLYQELLRSKELPTDGRLPPVLPIVLYNGTDPWTGTPEFQDLLSPAPLGLERYQPRFQYLLLDEERYPETTLIGQKNLAAALFRLDRSRSRPQLEAVIEDLLLWLKAPEQRSLQRAFSIWLKRVFMRRRLPGVEIPELDDLSEVRQMLAERWENWTREWEQQGLHKGLQKGLQQGLQEGLEKGLQEGLEKGLQEGLQQGLQQGLQKGKKQEQLRIAQSLLDLITGDEILAEKTGLSIMEVRTLRAEGLPPAKVP